MVYVHFAKLRIKIMGVLLNGWLELFVFDSNINPIKYTLWVKNFYESE